MGPVSLFKAVRYGPLHFCYVTLGGSKLCELADTSEGPSFATASSGVPHRPHRYTGEPMPVSDFVLADISLVHPEKCLFLLSKVPSTGFES